MKPLQSMLLVLIVLACADKCPADEPGVANAGVWPESGPVEAARAQADSVVIAYIHNVTQPRGAEGNCRAYGQVVNVERGTQMAFGRVISVTFPCSSITDAATTKHVVAMSAVAGHHWARLYYSQRRIVDYVPLELRPLADGRSGCRQLLSERSKWTGCFRRDQQENFVA